MNYSEWEESTTEILSQLLNIGYSEACGVIEAQDFYMTQSWGQGLTSEQAAKKIIEKVFN